MKNNRKNNKNNNFNNKQEVTLLGRLRYRFIRELGISDELASNFNLIKKKLLEAQRFNLEMGQLLMRIFGLSETSSCKIEDLQFGYDFDKLLDELEKKPWPKGRFLEIESRAGIKKESIGCFIYQEELRDSGRVYVITVFEEEFFPSISRIEIRASAAHPEPFFSVLSENIKFVPFSRQQILDELDELNPLFKIALLSLAYLNDQNPKLSLTLAEATLQSAPELFPPPKDPNCDELIQKTLLNKLVCTRLEVPLENIKPANYEHSILLPSALIRPFMYDIRVGDRAEILVYWKDNVFLVSDDYAVYLAYRTLKINNIPVIIMGKYPEKKFGFGEKGGAELLPNVTYRHNDIFHDTINLDIALDKRLEKDLGKNPKDKLYEFIFRLHKHLNYPLTKERVFHDLLIHGAREFAEGAFKVQSEVRLGKKYRIDLVIQLTGDAQRIILVELERANLPLFTKTGAPFAHVTHALQQVEDWLRFWQEHPNDILNNLDPTIAPSGIVVIGRSRNLNEDDKRRLLSLNNNRRVQLITYDDLIGRIENYAAWSM